MTAVSVAVSITAAYSPTTLTAKAFLAASTALLSAFFWEGMHFTNTHLAMVLAPAQQLVPISAVVTFSKGCRGKRKSALSSCKEELPIFLCSESLQLLLPCYAL
eukprot:13549255-Ditylum_brightwellii.AAC.1